MNVNCSLKKKRNEILLFAITWVKLESIILSEISHTEKEEYHMISLICRILKTTKNKNQTKQRKNEQAHRYREQICGCRGKGWGEWMKKGEGNLRSTKFQLQNECHMRVLVQHRKYNQYCNSCMVTDGYKTYHGDHFIRYINVKLLFVHPKLYVNYT